MDTQQIGGYAFIVGVVIAIIAGLAGFLGPSMANSIELWAPLLLVILGLVVGLLNVTDKETEKFLIAAAALMLTGTASVSLGVIPTVGPYLAAIVKNIAVFVAPAALIVALKSVWNLARSA